VVPLAVSGPLTVPKQSFFPRAIHNLVLVPNLNAGMVTGGEQPVCTGLRFRIGVAIDHVGCRDPISGVKVVKAINGHGGLLCGLSRCNELSLRWIADSLPQERQSTRTIFSATLTIRSDLPPQ
jgi:hypothetical protein